MTNPIDYAWAFLKADSGIDLLSLPPEPEPPEPAAPIDPANYRQTSLTEFGLEMPEQEQEKPPSPFRQLPGILGQVAAGAGAGLWNTAFSTLARGRKAAQSNTKDAMNINYQTSSPEQSSFAYGR